MKFIKIMLIAVFAVVLLSSAGVFIFVKTFDANRYKPLITQRIEEEIGREVIVGDIRLNLSFQRGAELDIANVSVADDPGFSSEPFLTIRFLHLGLDLTAFLRERKVIITDAVLKAPKVTIIRDSKGRFNIEDFSTRAKREGEEKISRRTFPLHRDVRLFPLVSRAEAAETALDFFVKTVQLKGGVVQYVDRTLSPAANIPVTDIELILNDFKFDELFPFTLRASLFSTTSNIGAEGRARFSQEDRTAEFSDVSVRFDMDALEWEDVAAAASFIEGMETIGEIEGSIEKDIQGIVVDSEGLQNYQARTVVSISKLSFRPLASPFRAFRLVLDSNETTAVIKECQGRLAEGRFRLEGQVEDYMGRQDLTLKGSVEEVRIEDVIRQEEDASRLSGRVDGDFELTGQGLNPSALRDNLRGRSSLELLEGKLTGINVLRVVLDKLSFLPRLREKMEAKLPEKYKELLKKQDTDLKKVNMTGRLSGGEFAFDESLVEAEAFLMRGKGTLNVDRQIDMEARIFIPEDLTASMIEAVEELKYLMDDSGRIVIPLKVLGEVNEPRFFPDLNYLSEKTFKERGRQELNKLLDKVFEKDTEEQPPSGEEAQESKTQDGSSRPQDEEASPERELIDGVLDAIFGE